MSQLQIKDYLRESNMIQTRLIVSVILIFAMALVLIIRLHYVQVVQTDRYVTLAQSNRINLMPVPPVRGRVFDRNGVVLAENFTVYNLEVTPDQISKMDKVIDDLARLVQITDRDVTRFKKLLKKRPGFERQTLRTNLTDAEAARFAANRQNFPGVELQARLQRHYPQGALTGHVLGYVGRISEQDLDTIDRAAYSGTEYIGKLGIESQYEDDLLGTVGVEQVETNAHGRIVRKLSRTPAKSGQDLFLSIDTRLQKAVFEAMGDWRGAVVAIEPASGDVLAMVSTPAYDPNPFVEGIDTKSYSQLRTDEGRPLLNRALHGRYAPGSTIKPFMSLALMEHGAHPGHTVNCPGFYQLPGVKHKYRCWKRQGHGKMNMHDAVVQSCDVYFYKRSRELGITRMHKYLTSLGLGKVTGIDLEGEPSGLIPSKEWKRAVHDQPWYPGETIIAGIGQGYTLATPLQLASATAMLARRGQVANPRFVRSVMDPATGETKDLGVVMTAPTEITSPVYFDKAIQAMEAVVHGKRGTARRIGADSPYRIAGKTGTAQVVAIRQGEKYDEKKLDKKFHDHALFISFAPIDNPQIAVAVVAENGGGGSRTAAPIARKVMDSYLVDIMGQYKKPEPEIAPAKKPGEA